MKKIWKLTVLCLLAIGALWCGSVLRDRKTLNEDLIRLHVVAASDSRADQAVKLRVRDEVTACMQADLADIEDAREALAYLREKLPELEETANRVLEECGVKDRARVSLQKEAFDTRVYDTFTLPAGVYESLRITIGEGEGKNWWCVVFPTLCVPATAEGFEETAQEAGLEDALACALTGETGYEVRFFFLDVLGKLENMFHRG